LPAQKFGGGVVQLKPTHGSMQTLVWQAKVLEHCEVTLHATQLPAPLQYAPDPCEQLVLIGSGDAAARHRRQMSSVHSKAIIRRTSVLSIALTTEPVPLH